jgi:hypothetical protein
MKIVFLLLIFSNITFSIKKEAEESISNDKSSDEEENVEYGPLYIDTQDKIEYHGNTRMYACQKHTFLYSNVSIDLQNLCFRITYFIYSRNEKRNCKHEYLKISFYDFKVESDIWKVVLKSGYLREKVLDKHNGSIEESQKLSKKCGIRRYIINDDHIIISLYDTVFITNNDALSINKEILLRLLLNKKLLNLFKYITGAYDEAEDSIDYEVLLWVFYLKKNNARF